jgi:hypothetical protein
VSVACDDPGTEDREASESYLPDRSSILSEDCNTSILRTGLPARHRYRLGLSPASRLTLPRSGLERSDFVHWPRAAELGAAASRQLSGVHRS